MLVVVTVAILAQASNELPAVFDRDPLIEGIVRVRPRLWGGQ